MNTESTVILELIGNDGHALDITHDGLRYAVTATDRHGERWRARAADLDDAAFGLAEMMGWDWMDG